MLLQHDILARIDDALFVAEDERVALTLLRQTASGVSAIRCDAEDMRDERPFRTYPGCNLFLLDGRDHCFRITQELTEATGFVVAPRLNLYGGVA